MSDADVLFIMLPAFVVGMHLLVLARPTRSPHAISDAVAGTLAGPTMLLAGSDQAHTR